MLRYSILLLLATFLAGCANIVPPTGGEKDVTPPRLKSINPKDSLLNTKVTKLELGFDEYITLTDASKQVQISPLLKIPLTVTSGYRRVTVSIPDTLLEEGTTYRITFGTAVRDLHEGNIWEGGAYTFSTGAFFDSLSLRGTVYDARTGQRDSAAEVLLYAVKDGDSAVVKMRPRYVVHTDAAGNFVFKGLPDRSFRIYALRDGNANLTFDGGTEWIGFSDSLVTARQVQTDDLELRTFQEPLPDSLAANKSGRTGSGRLGETLGPIVAAGNYVVDVDTSDLKKRSKELDQPLNIRLGRKLAAPMDAARLFLTLDSAGATVEAPFTLKADSTGRLWRLNARWQQDAVYTLRLQKGFAKDSNGNDLLPGRFTFRTKRDEDYGKLRVHLPSRFFGKQFLFQVSNEQELVYDASVTDTMIFLPRLQPGVYTIKVIVDANKNGRWDAGDLLAHVQPEFVVPYSGNINLKAGWEQQIDFEIPKRRSLSEAVDKR